MSRCKTVSFFYNLIPLSRWRAFLIRRHIEGCAHCQAGLPSRAESRSLFVQERAVGGEGVLWTKIGPRLAPDAAGKKETARTAPIFRRWGWAVAAAFLAVLITGVLLIKDFRPEGTVAATAVPARFELEYVRIGGQPADTVVYQPHGSDMIIVWAGKGQ
ncbi:MAG: hypothetical protein WBC70_09720 [Candidatus Aminicenantales bacterium]